MKKIVILAGVLALHTSGIAKAPELAQTQHTNAAQAALAGQSVSLTPTLAKSAQAQNVLRNLAVFSGRGGAIY